MDIAREEGYQVEETAFTLHDVYVADEVFLTGTAAEVIPAISADNRLIGDGSPGVITKHLLKKFRRSEEHTSELQSRFDLVCRLLLEKKKNGEESIRQ